MAHPLGGEGTLARLSRLVVLCWAMQSSKVFSVVCLLISAFLGSRLLAQPATVQLAITIMEPSGGVVPGAEVTLTQPSDMAQPLLFADRNGKVTVNAQPGEYELLVYDPGFKTARLDVVVTSQPEQTLIVHLQIGDTGSPIIAEHAPPPPPKLPRVRNLPSSKDLPAECRDPGSILPLYLSDGAGVPRFFAPHDGLRYGVSFPTDSDHWPGSHRERESSAQFHANYAVSLYIWVDNQTSSDAPVGSCSLFARWNIDVWSASGQRMLSHREQKDLALWPEHFSCAANAILSVPAHSCAVVTEIDDLGGLYTLPPGLYTVAERPAQGQPLKAPSPGEGLSFAVVK